MKCSILKFLVLTFTFSIGCSSTPGHKTHQQPKVHNLGPAFIEFWNSVKNKSPDEQVIALKKDFFPMFPEFYQYKIDNWEKHGGNPDKAIKQELAEFPKIEKEFSKKTQQITKDLNSTMESFIGALPDFNSDIEVFITHSFGDMDGGTRNIDNKVYFILGIDGMVKYHKGMTSETPFFHHELFHVYHGQFLAEEQIVWLALWVEGLATYASKKLNPEATYKDMLLDMPHGMINKINSDLLFHWNDLESKLESRKDTDFTHYFLMNSKHKRIVVRSGYYLGYLIAKEIGQEKDLSEMAKMSRDEILPTIRKTIKKLKKSNLNFR